MKEIINKAITKYKIDKNGYCWNWDGEINEKGYGRVQANGKRMSAHRYFYECFKGKTPKGLEIDHLCRNRKCVNPQHLEAVTHSENIKRAWKIRLENSPTCKNGHPYSGDNLFWVHHKKKNKKWRGCKICRKINNRQHYLNRTSQS